MRGYHDFGVALQDPRVARVERVAFTWHYGEVLDAAKGLDFRRRPF